MTNASAPALQRVGPLARLPALLAAHGASLDRVLEGLPVHADDLQPDRHLPLAVVSKIIERAAAIEGLSDLGLQLAASQNHEVLGPAGQLMACCETLGSALGTFAALQIANSTAGAAYLLPAGDDCVLGFGIYAAERPSSHIYDISAAIGFNMLRDLTGGAVQPHEVLLSRPVPAAPEAYRRFFRCPVRFNEHQTCMILPGRSLGFRLPGANAAERARLLMMLQTRMMQHPPAFVARVRHALRPMLIAGTASLREVAAHLNLHARTLGRRLEEEGATFEQLKDEVRLAVARDLLARTEISASDVAAALGYATPSAFVRAFRRWTGQSPTAWRRSERMAGASA